MRMADVFIALGAFILLVGVILRFAPGLFGWFGNLPGDIRVDGDRTTVFIPLTSMIVVSLVLSIVLNLITRVLGE